MGSSRVHHFGHTKPPDFVHEVEVGDRHIRLAFTAPDILLLPHLPQDGAGRLGSQKVVIGRARALELEGGWGGCGRLHR